MHRISSGVQLLIAGVLLIHLQGCDAGNSSDSTSGTPSSNATCTVPREDFADGGIAKDAIPALSNPAFVSPVEVNYLAGTDRVIGLVVEGQAYAVPHNLLWSHEIANLDLPSLQVAVTYCPLTGSSLAFDRAAIGGHEFGVSGLLLHNNLTMHDRTTSESLWPQMMRQAACGPRLGASLRVVPVVEMTWAGWHVLNPNTVVLSDDTGYGFGYTAADYPYGNYEEPSDGELLVPMDLDERRLPKERVLGVPNGRQGGLAFPFDELDAQGAMHVVQTRVSGRPIVVFWDRAKQGAMAYEPALDGQRLTFTVRNAVLVDAETGSTWRLDGVADTGPLAHKQLTPIAEAYVAFWFAWAAFHPDTAIWTSD